MTQIYSIDCSCADDGTEIYIYDSVQNLNYWHNYLKQHEGHEYAEMEITL